MKKLVPLQEDIGRRFLDRIILPRKIVEIWSKLIQSSLNCISRRERLNSFCKGLKCDFLILISVCKKTLLTFSVDNRILKVFISKIARQNLRKLGMTF